MSCQPTSDLAQVLDVLVSIQASVLALHHALEAGLGANVEGLALVQADVNALRCELESCVDPDEELADLDMS